MKAKDRHEQARRLSERYRKAGRKEKAMILDAFCMAAGLNRKYAISLLRNRLRRTAGGGDDLDGRRSIRPR